MMLWLAGCLNATTAGVPAQPFQGVVRDSSPE